MGFVVCVDCSYSALSIDYTSAAASCGGTTVSPGESPIPGSGGEMACPWGRAAMAFGHQCPLCLPLLWGNFYECKARVRTGEAVLTIRVWVSMSLVTQASRTAQTQATYKPYIARVTRLQDHSHSTLT